ncbi:MAG: hypothetical protein IPG08_11120 [Sphingobacteriaceae bacterium]|nr:hypothetical protein [Sphingobacteriaceae bacterium]
MRYNAKDVKPYKIEEAINLVVANGNYNENLSDKIVVSGITINCLNDLSGKDTPIGSLAKSNSDAFIALSNAFSGNGIYLQIHKDNVIPMPINIIYINSAKVESFNFLVVLFIFKQILRLPFANGLPIWVIRPSQILLVRN